MRWFSLPPLCCHRAPRTGHRAPCTAPLPFSRPGNSHRHHSAARSALALRTAAAAFPAGSPHAGDLLAQLERLRALFKARFIAAAAAAAAAALGGFQEADGL